MHINGWTPGYLVFLYNSLLGHGAHPVRSPSLAKSTLLDLYFNDVSFFAGCAERTPSNDSGARELDVRPSTASFIPSGREKSISERMVTGREQ
jgi:hypothetical protein